MHGGSGGSWRFSAGGGVGDAGKDAWNLPADGGLSEGADPILQRDAAGGAKGDRQPVFRREFRDGGGGRTLFPTGGKADGGRSWEEIEKFPDDLPLRKQDLEALQALGENLGYADKKTQERTILFYLEQADDSLAFLKKEMESRTKLYRSLGMAAGLFILVLFA